MINPSPHLQTALAAALDAAQLARAAIAEFVGGDLQIETKSDQSPVTAADKAAEKAIRGSIKTNFPDHAFFGEEYGRCGDDDEYLWLVDPIDGTKCFIRELPFYSIQIALMHRGELVLGVSSAPLLNELAYAEQGCGAWLNGQPLKVNSTTQLDRAYFSTGNLKWPAGSPMWQRLGTLHSEVLFARGYGDFFHYHRLAAGQLDIVLEQGVNILDIGALAVIVREAGGLFTDLDGDAINMGTSSVLAAATPELHQQTLHIMNQTNNEPKTA